MLKPTSPVVPCLHGGSEPSPLPVEHWSKKQFWLLFAAVFLSFPSTKDAAMSHVAAPTEIRVIDLPGLISFRSYPPRRPRPLPNPCQRSRGAASPCTAWPRDPRSLPPWQVTDGVESTRH